MDKKYEVTIIIPVYNAEEYIINTLNSVENQNFNKNVEVLIINDGSEDNSINIIENFISNSSNSYIDYKLYDDGINKGQGARRNFGIEIAKGESILFLDSDDYLVEDALKIAHWRLMAVPDNSFAIFEWAYYYPETGETKYINKEQYNKKNALYRETCELLLACTTYFSVNKLYKKEFLIDHDIRFGEGYLYEDFEFYVKSVLRSVRVPVISNILYKVRVHDNSSTKSDGKTLKHRDSFLVAIERALKNLYETGYRHHFTPYHVVKYFLHRCLLYSENRLPKRKNIRKKFIYDTMQILNDYLHMVTVPNHVIPLYDYAFNKHLIRELKVKKMQKIFRLHRKNLLNHYANRKTLKANKKHNLKHRVKNNYYLEPLLFFTRRKVHKHRKKQRDRQLKKYLDLNINNETILMLGFDYQYRGNSKYLFNYLQQKFSSNQLKIVSFDKNINEEYRITPRSDEFYKYLYTSKVIIGESWIPLAFKKRDGQVWIQLWHGTPFKRMLFDSNEFKMLSLNPSHKTNKKSDIDRWDYLLADSSKAVDKFITSYDIDRNKIINFGYPRNEWLVKNLNNKELIRNFKLKNNIPLDKKIILYAPTWRDYNYLTPESRKDTSYIADFNKLLKNLDDEYIIINKAHPMDKQPSWNNGIRNVLTVNNNVDSQELILISDIIVTDFSSIIFDAVHINKPFYLLIKDFNKYINTRGVYMDMYNSLLPLVSNSEIALANNINKNKFNDFNIPESYKNSEIRNANVNIEAIIKESFIN